MDRNEMLNESESTSVIDLGYEKTEVETVKEWSKANNIIVILPTHTVDQLEDLWARWNSMASNQKDSSDNISMQVFHMNNYTHFVGLRSRFYNGDPATDLSPEEYVSSNLIMGENAIDLLNNFTNEINKKDTFLNRQKLFKEASDKLENLTSINEYCLSYDAPYFLPEKMLSLGVYSTRESNYYNEFSDNKFLDKNKTVSIRAWFENYILSSKGFITENAKEYSNLWRNKLYKLYEDYDDIKNSNDNIKLNARKQSILEMGWNPEIDFNFNTRLKSNDKFKTYIESVYKDTKFIDLSYFDMSDSVIQENKKEEDNTLYPLYIMLSYTQTPFGRVITKITDCKYSHAAFSFDPSLTKMYSFNARNGNKGGLSFESIKKYPDKNNKSIISVYTVFIKKPDLLKIKMTLDNWVDNFENTSYSFLNALAILFNKPIQFANKMICSEFVDSLLKSINIDITHKPSGLVTPKDFYLSANKDKKIYKLYEGLISKYNPDKVMNKVSRLKDKVSYIKENNEILTESQFISSLKESYNMDNILYLNENTDIIKSDKELYILYESYIKSSFDIQPYCEAKEFPVEFDKEGNLLIKRKKHINFEKEYANSHRLLKLYSSNGNNNSMAYELAKLWYLNLILESKIYDEKNTKEELVNYHKARAKILNDFNKYLKELQSHESMKKFNFQKYFESTPFSEDKMKITNHTLRYSGKYLKDIIKGLLK